MSESKILASALLAVGALPDVRISRNNSGAPFDRTGRLVRYGLFQPGGSDAIGFKSIIVTPDMVGHRVAVFVAMEAKTATGRFRSGQREFIHLVLEAGGRAGVVHSAADALRLVGA